MQTAAPPPPANPPALSAPATSASPDVRLQRVTLTSELPTGDAAEDAIVIEYYAAATTTPSPAMVVLPPIGGKENDPTLRRLAEKAARQGLSTAIVTLPYHGKRWPKGETGQGDPALHFLSGDAVRSEQAFAQSASDVMTVIGWLASRPNTDPHRIGIVGISLGAIIAHLVMGRDDRISAGVAFLGGGDLADISQHSSAPFLLRLFHPAQRSGGGLTLEESKRILSRVDPITFASGNRPRKVLMIEAARDFVVPPRDATALWEALGRPPIRWIDSNHFALRLASNAAFDAALSYLQSVWNAPHSRGGLAHPDTAAHRPDDHVRLD